MKWFGKNGLGVCATPQRHEDANIYLYLNHMALLGSVMSSLVPIPDNDMVMMVVVAILRKRIQHAGYRPYASVWYKLLPNNFSVHGKRHIHLGRGIAHSSILRGVLYIGFAHNL